MNVLGLTFDEVQAALKPPPQEVRALRAGYKRLMRGDLCETPLRVDLLPIVRRVEDCDLIKFVQRTSDGYEIESVVVPMLRRGRSWKTLCVSSQIGCRRGCRFCETAQIGFVRDLTAGEIVNQVVTARRYFGDVRNVVFMGMGEPFDNFDAVIQAIRVLTESSGLCMARERISVSTVGRIEGIRRLIALRWRRLNLAISLNAPNDEIRAKIMPVARTEPMAELRDALLEYPLRNCQYLMMEYVLIPGVNDAREHAREVAEYLRPLQCILNVIPYNPRHESPWKAPTDESITRFMAWLTEAGQLCKRRITKGRDQMAACGQLGNRQMRNSA